MSAGPVLGSAISRVGGSLASRQAVVGVSSGVGSAYTWALAVAEYGAENTVGLFADVNGEHPDNYRFLAEVHEAVGGRLVKLGNDGDTIWDVFSKEKFLGNTRVAMCSRVLKFEASLTWMRRLDPTVTDMVLGIDHSEERRFTGWTDARGKRHAGQQERWEGEGFGCRAPMVEQVLDKGHALAWCEAEGILPPLLTRLGFNHANCWGGCVKSGAKQFTKLLHTLPEGYAKWEAGEERLRAEVGPYAILRDRRGGVTRPLSLQVLRQSECEKQGLFDADDKPACGCFGFDDDEEAT